MLNLQFSHRRALTSHSVVHGKAGIVERTRTVHWVVVSLVIVYWAAGYHPPSSPVHLWCFLSMWKDCCFIILCIKRHCGVVTGSENVSSHTEKDPWLS